LWSSSSVDRTANLLPDGRGVETAAAQSGTADMRVVSLSLYAYKSHVFVQNLVFCPPHLHSTPPLGGSRLNIHPVWYGRTRMMGLPDGEDMFIRFDMIHERDRCTQTHKHRMAAYIAHLCIASRGKNHPIFMKFCTQQHFELDERHAIKNEKVALNRLRVRQNVYFFL